MAFPKRSHPIAVVEGVMEVGELSPSVSRTLGEEDSFDWESVVGDYVAKTVIQDQTNIPPIVIEKMPQTQKLIPGAARKDLEKKPLKQNAKTWTNLFPNNRKHDAGITLTPTVVDEDVIKVSMDDIDDLGKVWGYGLVGYFAPRHPGKKALMEHICNKWGVAFDYFPNVHGWMAFRFNSKEDRCKVLSGGPYSVFGSPLLLKLMPDGFRFGKDDATKVPVWAILPGLPLEWWTDVILSRIASKMGKPIATDSLTKSRQRISYARILVEVDLSKPPCKVVKLCSPFGECINQSVYYESVPPYCNLCKCIGHVVTHCPTNKASTSKTSTTMPPPKTLALVKTTNGAPKDAQKEQIFGQIEVQTGQLIEAQNGQFLEAQIEHNSGTKTAHAACPIAAPVASSNAAHALIENSSNEAPSPFEESITAPTIATPISAPSTSNPFESLSSDNDDDEENDVEIEKIIESNQDTNLGKQDENITRPVNTHIRFEENEKSLVKGKVVGKKKRILAELITPRRGENPPSPPC